MLREAFKARRRRGEPVIGYFHPYDIDLVSRDEVDPGLGSLFNFLLGHNRGAVLPRLRALVADGYRIETYRSHAERLRAELTEEGNPGA